MIDMLNDFVHPDGALYVGGQVKETIQFSRGLIADSRGQNIPVIYICDAHRQDDSEFSLFPAHCVRGTWGAQIYSELSPAADDFLVEKRRFSAFFGTSLDIFLREKNITELAVVGVCTNICVLYTVCSARSLNYQVEVYRRGVTSFDLEAHDFALREIQNTLGAQVVEQ